MKVLVVMLAIFFCGCVTKVRTEYIPVFTKVGYPSYDEGRYLQARKYFIEYEKKLTSQPKYKKLFTKLKPYFNEVRKVQSLKNIYMKNMKIAITEHNKMSVLDVNKITR